MNYKIVFIIILVFYFIPKSIFAADVPTLSFAPANKTVKLGEQFSINLIIDTAGKQSLGVGGRINFDPSYLKVINLSDTGLFDSYNTLSFDNQAGKISVSAVNNNINKTYAGRDIYAVVKFEPISLGVTNANYNFTLNSTNDSNIPTMEGNGEILEQVIPLNINILEDNNTHTWKRIISNWLTGFSNFDFYQDGIINTLDLVIDLY